MRSFRERNPMPIGIAGLATAGLMTALAFNLQHFSEGTAYSAAFSEAAGLKAGEEVCIAGVKVGKVESVDVEGDHVKVRFASGRPFCTDTLAKIKIKTLLGSHYLALEPKGPGRQSPHQEIPVSRTNAPYDVVPALQDASAQLSKIDAKQLAESFDTLSQTMRGSSANVQGTLTGLRKISRAVASRDDELSELLKHTAPGWLGCSTSHPNPAPTSRRGLYLYDGVTIRRRHHPAARASVEVSARWGPQRVASRPAMTATSCSWVDGPSARWTSPHTPELGRQLWGRRPRGRIAGRHASRAPREERARVFESLLPDGGGLTHTAVVADTQPGRH